MKQIRKHLLACCGMLGTLLIGWQSVDAHDGRRMDIQVLNNQLIAQGYISGTVDPADDDGGGLVRPYYNAIHGHWKNSLVSDSAFATLPGFDIQNPGELTGQSLVLELMGAKKWVNPVPPMHGMIGTPVLQVLDLGEILFIGFGMEPPIETDSLGSFPIANNILPTGVLDIDMEYSIAQKPTDFFYAIEWKLSAPGSSILASGPIYTILAPDPTSASMMEKHHYHQSALAMESFLGVTAIPEPGAASLLTLLSLVALRRGRRSAKA